MVLARTPDAPEGVKGISLFIVPKFLPKADGAPGERNDLRVASIEHKLGIHASPTCVMAYGDGGGAIGYLVGEECRGIERSEGHTSELQSLMRISYAVFC